MTRTDNPTRENMSTLDVLTGLRHMAEAEPDYIEAKENFEGTRPEFFASHRIARRIGESGKRFRINIAKKPVTAVVDRLEIAAVSVTGNDTATDRLRAEVWDANELSLEAPIIHRKACEFGDEYVFLTEGDTDRGEPAVVIERSGALTTRVIYDPERPRRPKYGIKTWPIGHGENKRVRVNLYYPPDDEDGGRIERWITRAGDKGTDAEHWIPYTESDGDGEETVPAEEELTRFPIYHFRTDRPYGTPVHLDAYGAQAALNKLLVTLMATVDQQGYPTRYALTDGAASDDGDSDDDFGDLDDDAAGVTDVEADRGSKLRSGPGEVWWLDGVKEAGQFEPADPDAFLKPADWIVRMAAQATDTPLHMYDPGGDQPSGDSRRAALDTLVKKVGWLSLSFGSTWKQLLRDALAILGITVAEVDVRWAPFDAVDDAEGWATVKAKIDAGVPVRQALLEAGYTADQVDEWLSGNVEHDMKRKVAMIAELAKAARDLGTASGMGVISPGLVEEVMRAALPAEEPTA